jgi:hypothetical protein
MDTTFVFGGKTMGFSFLRVLLARWIIAKIIPLLL